MQLDVHFDEYETTVRAIVYGEVPVSVVWQCSADDVALSLPLDDFPAGVRPRQGEVTFTESSSGVECLFEVGSEPSEVRIVVRPLPEPDVCGKVRAITLDGGWLGCVLVDSPQVYSLVQVGNTVELHPNSVLLFQQADPID